MKRYIKVFRYLEELDAFLPTDEFSQIVRELGLSEWTDVTFLCRYLALDNDYGEHIFDNWDEREEREEKAAQLGIEAESLLIVVPERFQNGWDGPCHSPVLRKMFWTDLFKSLELSLDFLLAEARRATKRYKRHRSGELTESELEERIAAIGSRYEISNS